MKLARSAGVPDLLFSLVSGALAGFLATVPMTIAMTVLHQRLPWSERYPLPPREITEVVAAETGLSRHLDEPGHLALTMLAHFGYGAAVGFPYGPIAGRTPLPPWLAGPLYGLMIWTVSYLGWLPALGILRPATEHPARRNGLMIAAHLVWGSALALLADWFQARR